MIALAGRVFERGSDVSVLEEGIIREYLLARGAGGQQIEHVFDPYAKPPQAGPPAALARIDPHTSPRRPCLLASA